MTGTPNNNYGGLKGPKVLNEFETYYKKKYHSRLHFITKSGINNLYILSVYVKYVTDYI